jgi:hypothetical protein
VPEAIQPVEPSASSPAPADPAAPDAAAQRTEDAAAEPTDVGAAQTGDATADDEESADTEPGSSDVSAAGADRDCPDFSSQEEAQDYFDENGGSATNNFDLLDADGDGIACEDLPSDSGTSGSPSGGVDTGGGGMAAPSTREGPLVPVLGGAGAGLLVGCLMILALRRRAASV